MSLIPIHVPTHTPPGLVFQRPKRPAGRSRGGARPDPRGHRLFHHRRRRPQGWPLRIILRIPPQLSHT